MAEMTDREVLKLVKKYIGIDAGNLMEFSYNLHSAHHGTLVLDFWSGHVGI